MTEEEIDALIAGLPPEAKLVVSLLREQNAQQRAQNERLSEQIDKLQQILFGRQSEKMPPLDKILRDEEPPTEMVDGKPMPEDDEDRKKQIRRRNRKESATKRTEPAPPRNIRQRFILETLASTAASDQRCASGGHAHGRARARG